MSFLSTFFTSISFGCSALSATLGKDCVTFASFCGAFTFSNVSVDVLFNWCPTGLTLGDDFSSMADSDFFNTDDEDEIVEVVVIFSGSTF